MAGLLLPEAIPVNIEVLSHFAPYVQIYSHMIDNLHAPGGIECYVSLLIYTSLSLQLE
jgi:hypothetical protein